MPIEIFIRDRDFPQYDPYAQFTLFRKVKRNGLMYSVQGEPVELFFFKTFCECIDRSPNQVRGWEAERKIPKAFYSVPHPNGKGHPFRAYSAAQCQNLNRLFINNYRAKKYLHSAELMAKFHRDMTRVLGEKNLMTSLTGYIDVPVDDYSDLFASKEEYHRDKWKKRVRLRSTGGRIDEEKTP